mmetsp:Transcript_12259/g.18308  ORF Transcript_12259/g.18308 Transcript_12259/m.18308 type:complete len:152 (+) Transcript_12259:54-509(+)
MGRMHGKGRGISQSVIPYNRNAPNWLKLTPNQVEERVCKLARKGLTPAQIGIYLRDNFGVGQVKNVTGKKVLRILKSNGFATGLPEDLYHLIKKAVTFRKHLSRNNRDKVAKYRLQCVEAKIHRLSRYYKKTRVLEPNWKYEAATAEAHLA